METFYTEEVLPIRSVSDRERHQRMWIIKRKKIKKKLKEVKENFEKKKSNKHIIDVYV